ncbi:MAG: hypothetical protein F6K28_42135 [Microcoleus sp. SIO2G3]|nr:hypothetical protein [Microcoleus sp. SIO2G3]
MKITPLRQRSRQPIGDRLVWQNGAESLRRSPVRETNDSSEQPSTTVVDR